MASTPVLSLNLNDDWQISAIETPTPTIYLTRSFWLEPLDICVGYWLHVENAPAGAIITINDQHIGSIENSGIFIRDVTNFVWLEKNTITFELTYTLHIGKLSLNNIRLDAVPCE